jgi:LacI family transcriptional regulator
MVTIKEIAQAVGVSPTTVSRVLNYDATLSVSEAKRRAIIETAEALDYATPRNRRRSGQQGGARRRIALLHFLRPADELADPYYIGVRLGIENRCQAARAEIAKVYHADDLPEASILREATGIIAVGRHPQREIEWIERHAQALVFADFRPPGERFDCVYSDLRLAAVRLVDALIEAGYRRLAFVGCHEVEDGEIVPYGEARCAAFIGRMRALGLFDPDLCRIDGKLRLETGYRLARDLFDRGARPEVIVAANDNVAIGVYRAADECGLKIPDDVCVVGFNDIPAAQFLSPPLSTMKIRAERIGETAVDLLLERLAGRDYVKEVCLATEMVWRDSCRSSPVAALRAPVAGPEVKIY